MPCQWGPTILTPALGWVAADSDIYPGDGCYPRETTPAWAGEPRGHFAFDAQAFPARLHFNRQAREAALGRALPATDPDLGFQEGALLYWNEYPRVLSIRNSSGFHVAAVWTRTGNCGSSDVVVHDTEEFDIGPFFGSPSEVRVHIVGPTLVFGGAPTVPSGVDVRVTEPARADPGLSFDFACAAPAVVAV